MRIFFTIVDDWRGERRDLWLEGDATATVASLTATLAGDGGRQPGWDGDRLLVGNNPIGLEVRDGAI